MSSKLTHKKSGVDIDEGDKFEIKGMAHITGGGIPGNLLRILPEGVVANIGIGSWTPQPIYSLIEDIGNVADEEMKRTFNMGIGYIIVFPEGAHSNAISLLNKAGFRASIIGNIERGDRGIRYS